MNTLLKIASQLSAEDLAMMDASLAKRKAQATRKSTILKGSVLGTAIGGIAGAKLRKHVPMHAAMGLGAGLGAAISHVRNANKVKRAQSDYEAAERQYILKKIKQG